MMNRPGSSRKAHEAGFTLVELLVAMVVFLTLVVSSMGMLSSQIRGYGLQTEKLDTRQTLRGAGTLLSFELRGASAERGDLSAIASQSLTMRSVQWSAVLCGTNGDKYGLWSSSGSTDDALTDSVLVFSADSTAWRAAAVSQVWAAGVAAGIPNCAWGAPFEPERVIRVTPGTPADTAGVRTGAALRGFRRVEYGLFQRAGRWWLGRKVGAATSYQLVTGPLRSPADSGLVFHYYDSLGVVTADPGEVHRVRIKLRAESYGHAQSQGNAGPQVDSLDVTAFLRN
jgi:prepilin-type N-terminal cleavage/methylation domain-containing protein